MKISFSERAPSSATACLPVERLTFTHVKSWLSTISLVLFVLAATLATTSIAKADSYNFSLSGSGISASGVFDISLTGPNGAFTVNSITGTFSDANNGFSGAITGLEPTGAPTLHPDGVTFSPPGNTGVFSFDNLFYPAGNSPAVCIDALNFFGGVFDVYGVAFDVAGGYTADVWSNGPTLGGYMVGDSLNGVKISPAGEGAGFVVNVATSPVPEPSSLFLLGAGLPGLVAVWKRKRNA
jgi:hypothetical protein